MVTVQTVVRHGLIQLSGTIGKYGTGAGNVRKRSSSPILPDCTASLRSAVHVRSGAGVSVYLSQAQNPGTAVFNTLNLLNLPTYVDNAAAVAGGLSVNDVYKTSTGELRIVI